MKSNGKLVSIEFSFITRIGKSPDPFEIRPRKTALTEYFNSGIATNKPFSYSIPGLEYPIIDTNISETRKEITFSRLLSLPTEHWRNPSIPSMRIHLLDQVEASTAAVRLQSQPLIPQAHSQIPTVQAVP